MADDTRKRKGAGRPTKLNDKVQAGIVKLIREGNFPDVAAVAEGISRRTFYDWMRRGEDEGSGAYAEFRTAVTRAMAEAEANLVKIVQTGDDRGESFGQAKAALEVLQRRFSKRWSVRVQHEIRDELERFLSCARRVCSSKDYARLLEELAREDGEGGADDAPPAPELSIN